jgi:hypothetical protein
MVLARRNKKLHQDSSAYYKRAAEASMVTALLLGASSGLLNVVLGVLDPTTILINVAQIVLGMTGLSATIIVQVAKQLELDANTIHHNEAALKYSELHRMIRSELVLLRRNDSSYASAEDVLKQCQIELNRIEESAPAVPEHIGIKCICSPTSSPGASSPRAPERV